MIVVLPVPASPIRTAMPRRAATAYWIADSASRCRAVRNKYRRLGVRSNGCSRRLKCEMYMQSLVLRDMVFNVLSRALASRAPVKHNDHSISCALGLAAHCCDIMNTFSGLNLIGKSHSFTECLKVIRKIAKR